MYRFVLQKSVRVTGVTRGYHISRVSSDRVWISDGNNLILTNTAGDRLHHLTGIPSGLFSYGVHTVNNDGDLIYIDSDYNINNLSKDDRIKTTLIKYKAPWRPQSVYSSLSTGDLLVGMYYYTIDTFTGKVVRYNSTGDHIKTIQHHHNTGHGLYSDPGYITENHNGDIIVSDINRVVVTDRRGRHRFSYRGPPSGSGLEPRGICTDELSHILVCDYNTDSVQMIDSDVYFLSHILTPRHGIGKLLGLSYDVRSHLLWVGSQNSDTINIYRVVDEDSLSGK
ncbi:uncharacterized protein LOC133202019 [Saccostrea echinata]|uniref:uncharacterized protein LOC133202019 n=1 Tax=Saccostrea echinata TaxID=191078 RepID=UPI002A80DE7A|nr:uncharacterized protein LOC133202019 [Saccostrea echinata]